MFIRSGYSAHTRNVRAPGVGPFASDTEHHHDAADVLARWPAPRARRQRAQARLAPPRARARRAHAIELDHVALGRPARRGDRSMAAGRAWPGDRRSPGARVRSRPRSASSLTRVARLRYSSPSTRARSAAGPGCPIRAVERLERGEDRAGDRRRPGAGARARDAGTPGGRPRRRAAGSSASAPGTAAKSRRSRANERASAQTVSTVESGARVRSTRRAGPGRDRAPSPRARRARARATRDRCPRRRRGSRPPARCASSRQSGRSAR